MKFRKGIHMKTKAIKIKHPSVLIYVAAILILSGIYAPVLHAQCSFPECTLIEEFTLEQAVEFLDCILMGIQFDDWLTMNETVREFTMDDPNVLNLYDPFDPTILNDPNIGLMYLATEARVKVIELIKTETVANMSAAQQDELITILWNPLKEIEKGFKKIVDEGGKWIRKIGEEGDKGIKAVVKEVQEKGKEMFEKSAKDALKQIGKQTPGDPGDPTRNVRVTSEAEMLLEVINEILPQMRLSSDKIMIYSNAGECEILDVYEPLLSDLNKDYQVNLQDLAIFSNQWLQ